MDKLEVKGIVTNSLIVASHIWPNLKEIDAGTKAFSLASQDWKNNSDRLIKRSRVDPVYFSQAKKLVKRVRARNNSDFNEIAQEWWRLYEKGNLYPRKGKIGRRIESALKPYLAYTLVNFIKVNTGLKVGRNSSNLNECCLSILSDAVLNADYEMRQKVPLPSSIVKLEEYFFAGQRLARKFNEPKIATKEYGCIADIVDAPFAMADDLVSKNGRKYLKLIDHFI